LGDSKKIEVEGLPLCDGCGAVRCADVTEATRERLEADREKFKEWEKDLRNNSWGCGKCGTVLEVSADELKQHGTPMCPYCLDQGDDSVEMIRIKDRSPEESVETDKEKKMITFVCVSCQHKVLMSQDELDRKGVPFCSRCTDGIPGRMKQVIDSDLVEADLPKSELEEFLFGDSSPASIRSAAGEIKAAAEDIRKLIQEIREGEKSIKISVVGIEDAIVIKLGDSDEAFSFASSAATHKLIDKIVGSVLRYGEDNATDELPGQQAPGKHK
jgi:hypothetical protein